MTSPDDRARDAPPPSGSPGSLSPPLEAIPTRVGQTTTVARPDELDRVNLPSRYLLGEKLGAGGMGVVVEAYDPRMRREIAIKRPLPGRDDGGRILAEARIQSALEHPAIVPVYEVGRDQDGRAYFTMRRLEGTTLAEVVRNSDGARNDSVVSRWSQNRLLRAYVDVCVAVDYAHSRGFVHCDLKPSNVLFGEFGEVYVLDWGTARRHRVGPDPDADGVPRARTAEGTPAYMAPEQFRANVPLTPAADVFALGAMLFEILVGEPLHPPRSTALHIEALYEHGKLVASPVARAPGKRVSPELDWICQASMRIDPAERIPSARQLADAVQSYLDGDRDLVIRRTIASAHLREAEELLETYEADPVHASVRADAFAEAARALAYDPTHESARDLVTRLLFETPAEIPQEVRDEVARAETRVARTRAEVLVATHVALLAFLPLFLAGGVRDAPALIAIVVVCVALILDALEFRRHPRPSTARVILRSLGDGLLIGLLSVVFGPFALPPAIALISALVHVGTSVPRARLWVTLCHATAPVVPVVLALTGVTDRVAITPETITIRAGLAPYDPTFTWLSLLIVPPTLVVIASYVRARLYSASHRAALKHELQRWHLRQVVGVGVRRHSSPEFDDPRGDDDTTA